MKYLFLVMMTVFVGACAHKHHGHDGAKTECGCDASAEKSGAMNNGEKKECNCGMKEGGAHEGCNHHGEQKTCCAEKACKHEGHQACTAETTSLLMSDKITQKISQEEFTKIYAKNKSTLGQKCTNQAMTYCGKTTKDMMVSETEASCLWSKVFRASRDTMPELDNTPCAKTIKGFVKK